MKKSWKRLGCLVLTLALLLSMIPMSAAAEEVTQAALQEAINHGQPGQTISVDGEIVLSQDLVIPAGKDVILSGTSETAYLHTSGEYTILVEGSLTLKNLKVGGNMNQGYAPVTLTKDHAAFYGEAVSIENTGASADGFGVSAQGIQIASGKKNSSGSPQNCTVELVDSSVYVDGAGARGICFAGKSEGTKVTLNHTTILNGENAQTQWQGGYSRGIALWNAADMEVLIQNDSQIAGFQYAINSGRQEETNGLKITVQDSDLRGWTTLNIWTDEGLFRIENSTLTGMNGSYNGDKLSSFSALVINGDIYNNGSGFADNNKIIIKDSAMHAITQDNQPVETLLRIDTDSTEVEFQGEVTFTDSTGGKAGAVFDIGNMDDPTAFIARHENLINQATILTPDGNPVFPVYELMNTFGDGEVTYGQSFKTFISGVDYEGAAAAKEKVILLRNVNEPEFAVNEEEGHGNQFGGWTLDLAGYTLTLAEWSGDKIKVMDSSPEKTGDIIVNGESVIAARNGENCYTSLSAAMEAAKDGETVSLMTDTTEQDGILLNKGEGSAVTLDLQGHTYTVAEGANVNNRGFKIQTGTLYVVDTSEEGTGTMVAKGSGTTSADGAGAYGVFRVEKDGVLYVTDVTLQNSRPWGLNVKVLGGKAYLEDVTILSSYGGGIEVTEASLGTDSKKGEAVLTNCTVNQTGYFDHCSSAVSVSGGSKLVVNGGTYSSEGTGIYVFSSGGEVEVTNGVFSGKKNVICGEVDTGTYPGYTGSIAIKGGKYTGSFRITSPASMAITDGYFSHDPSAYLAEGKVALPSIQEEYAFMVGDVTEKPVAKPAAGAPQINKESLPSSMEEEDKNTIAAAAASIKVPGGELSAAANQAITEVTEEQKSQAETAIKDSGILESSETTVNIYAQTYLEVIPTNYVAAETFTLHITPKYRVVASTAERPEDIVVKDEAEGEKEANAVVLEGSEKVMDNVKNMTIAVNLPVDFPTESLYVKHTKNGKLVAYHTAVVAENVLTFTNNKGFSEFTVAQDNRTATVQFGEETVVLTPDKIGQKFPAAEDSDGKIFKGWQFDGVSGLYTELTEDLLNQLAKMEVSPIVATPHFVAAGGGVPGIFLPFVDVLPGAWYYNDVVYAYQTGLIQGTTENTFSPKEEMTRAMLVTILYRMEGEPSVDGLDISFTDVPERYYTDAVVWAHANNIVSGYENNTFRPKEPITREQYVTILHRYALYRGKDVSGDADLTVFKDWEKVSGWAETAMIWAVDTGLIKGVTEDTISPKTTTKRHQGAALLTRFHQFIL